MGACGEGSEEGVQVLPADRCWKEAARGGRVEVEEADRRGRADHVASCGELRCVRGGGKIANRTWSARSAPTWSWKPKNNRRTGSAPSQPGMPRGGHSAARHSCRRRFGRCGVGHFSNGSGKICA